MTEERSRVYVKKIDFDLWEDNKVVLPVAAFTKTVTAIAKRRHKNTKRLSMPKYY